MGLKVPKRAEENYDLSDLEEDEDGNRIEPDRLRKHIPAWCSNYTQRRRGSSCHWIRDALTPHEIHAYAVKMGQSRSWSTVRASIGVTTRPQSGSALQTERVVALAVEALQRAPQWYCETLAERPWIYLAFWMVVVLVVLPLGWRPIVVDTDVNAYRRADGVASRAQLTYESSLSQMRAVRDEAALSQRTTLKLELLYEAKDGDVFSEAVLRDIRAFEQALRSLEGWARLCNMSEPLLQFQCSPGEGPAGRHAPCANRSWLHMTGLPLDAVIAYLREGRAAPHELRVFLPMSFAVGGQSTPGAPTASVKDFVEKELYSAMKEVVLYTRKEADPNSWDLPPAMQIYFRGDILDDHEVRVALYSDMLLAIGPLILSLLLAWVKFRSALLALTATTFLCLTVLLAYVILPLAKVSLASFLGVFMIFGLGFTSFFRMHELWRRSRLESSEYWERLLYLHTAAGREMLPVVCTSGCRVA
eukprot:g221.t1